MQICAARVDLDRIATYRREGPGNEAGALIDVHACRRRGQRVGENIQVGVECIDVILIDRSGIQRSKTQIIEGGC